MSTLQQLPLKVDELEQRLKRVEPAALLVPPRLLRRVIKNHRAIGGIALLVPHRKGYVIDREALLREVELAELGLAENTELPPFVFLMVRPGSSQRNKYSLDQLLLKHWKILFHLHIDHVMQQKLANGSLTLALVRQRIRKLGVTEFAEITTVLRQEDFLLPPESAEAVYAEFVAVYLTLRRFDPALVADFFPALRDLAAVDALVAEDVDADAIYSATRLLEDNKEPEANQETENCLPVTLSPSHLVTLSSLSDRLKTSLQLSDQDGQDWQQALLPLLEHAGGGSWSQEARLLYDLRSVCDDSEHGIYTVDLVEWAMSLGQLPIKRRLPGHQQVAIVRHLRRALGRLRLVRLTDEQRQRLGQLLGRALKDHEHLMRARFRPLIAAALDEVALKPPCVAEAIGRDKMVEELLDRVVEYGHLNMGNLRDAISRNQLKLPDLQGPAELVLGDPLIRLNRKLAVSLDGVYRRGEFYMRLLHRLSSVAFGTSLGRLLVLFLILPFGLAFFAMITPKIAVEEGEKLTQWVGQLAGLVEKPPVTRGQHTSHEFPMPNLAGVAVLGVFFLLLFHVRSFRNGVFAVLVKVGRVLHRVFIHWPVRLVHLPAVQALLHHPLWRLLRRCVFWPGLLAASGGLLAWQSGLAMPTIEIIAASCLVLGVVLLNTRVGRDFEETVIDWLLRLWRWLSIDLVPGLLRLIMDVSRWCLETVEQMLYTVGEWLRFRRGENRALVAVKAVVGLFWFWVTYVIRFAINLLIEPQINPIKHFPVVTVAHKVCLPLIPTLADILRNASVRRPTTTATGIIFGIPGIFGFMVWELKENWKLYRANRQANLQPVLIGSHGETMQRLLRPGFHSGTVPKLYQKLRRAERRNLEAARGENRAVRKILAALHHVGVSVEHFVERELLALLRQSKAWGGLAIELAPIRLATNRVQVDLRCPALAERPLVLAFDEQNGWLLAGVIEPGWLPLLNAAQRQTLALALAGLYKMAGVHLTREQINGLLPPTTFAFEITEDGLVVWTSADGSRDVVYDLRAAPQLPPLPLGEVLPPEMPVLDAKRLLFSDVPLAWSDWVRRWEDGPTDGAERPPAQDLLPVRA